MKDTKKVSSEKKPAYGDYTPSAKKQDEIDSLINTETRKVFGKVVAKVECLGLRNSFSKKGGAPYQRYVLANDHTVFVGGIHNDNLTVSVPEKKLDPKLCSKKSLWITSDWPAIQVQSTN
jgi:hypothetical protein